jgi:membrane associated rhomboid family serine protease
MGGMIPLGVASRLPRRSATITTLLIVANVIAFILELNGGDRFVLQWSAIPIRVMHGRHLITLLTSMFMHGGWMHIIGNMLYLWVFGPEIEDAMGSGRFLFFYLAGGLVAMLAQVAADPLSRIPVLGASGAIAAVMGAFIITYPRDRIKTVLFFFIFFRVAFIPAAFLIGFWFLMQLLNLGAVAHVQSGGVATLAHVAGFLFGVVTARLIEDPRRVAYRNSFS